VSQENVEVVRAAWDAFIHDGVEATFPFWTEDCVFEDPPEMPDGGVHYGHAGVVEAVRNFTEAWGDLTYEPIEFIDAGAQVIAVIGLRGEGGGSRAPLLAEVAWLFELREGKVIRSRAFTSKDQALAVVGLEKAADRPS
jgi:ketosteroid isomerase-like protein